MTIDYRHAKMSDIPTVAEVFATAIDDISRKHGFFDKPTPTSPPDPQYAFWLKKNPESFWVAEEGGRVVGYTFSFLRGPLWYLADLFILPQQQGKGIGGELIRKTLASWKGRRIANRALITPAFNRASVSLYMKFDMFPRQPVYFAEASRKAVEDSLDSGRKAELRVEEVVDFEASDRLLDRAHRLALGFPSGWHNQFFFEVLKARCLLFRRGSSVEGYSFVRSDGRIGPLVVRRKSSFAPALGLTLRAAAEGNSEKVTMFFPGTNKEASKTGSKTDFRIRYPLLFLSSKSLGDFENYLFHSPGLM